MDTNLKTLPYHRYLIVAAPFVGSSGLIRLITDPLDQHGAMYRIFSQVLPDPANHTKYPLMADSLLPDEAILDVELVKSVPAAVPANTGMDVFTHALESYVSLRCNEFSASGLGLNHGMAHRLGARFHVPHGAVNAMLLPAPYHRVQQPDHPRSKSRKEYDYTVRAQIAWTQFMMKEMDMHISMGDTGTCTRQEYEAAIPAMVEGALMDSCTVDNPRRPTPGDVAQIYRALW